MPQGFSRLKSAFAVDRSSARWLVLWVAVVSLAAAWQLHNPDFDLPFILLLATVVGATFVPIASGWRLLGIGLLIYAVIPGVAGSNGSFMDLATQMALYIVLALGLNIVVGFAGLLDLGFIAFFGSGAYLYGIFASSQASAFLTNMASRFPLSGQWFWLFLIGGLLLGGILGILLGLPVLRVRGDYLAIVTLGFGEIIQIVLNNLDAPINITNGPQGVIGIQPPMLGSIRLGQPVDYYLVVATLVIVALGVIRRLEYSRIGRSWNAVRDDELAAQAMGVPLVRTKLIAFACGASFAGMMGVVYAAKQTFISPTSFDYMQSVMILVMVILGGLGSVRGVVVGAMIVVLMQFQLLKDLSTWLQTLSSQGIFTLPSQIDPSQSQRLLLGILLIIMTLFRPKGIFPVKRRSYDVDKISSQARASGFHLGGSTASRLTDGDPAAGVIKEG